jgi:hypothetical protein
MAVAGPRQGKLSADGPGVRLHGAVRGVPGFEGAAEWLGPGPGFAGTPSHAGAAVEAGVELPGFLLDFAGRAGMLGSLAGGIRPGGIPMQLRGTIVFCAAALLLAAALSGCATVQKTQFQVKNQCLTRATPSQADGFELDCAPRNDVCDAYFPGGALEGMTRAQCPDHRTKLPGAIFLHPGDHPVPQCGDVVLEFAGLDLVTIHARMIEIIAPLGQPVEQPGQIRMGVPGNVFNEGPFCMLGSPIPRLLILVDSNIKFAQ